MLKPKTAKLKLEITNDDGSKTIVTTAELDATKLTDSFSPRIEDNPSHVVIGMSDPYDDEDDPHRYFRRANYASRVFPPAEDHFFLNLRMPPVDKNGFAYTIQEIAAPDTRVIMLYTGGEIKLCYWTEEEAQTKSREMLNMGAIYFFLDIP